MKSKGRGHLVRYRSGVGVLCALYFITARLGLKLGAVSGFATLVWPPTGIALAALLIFGNRFWPGVAMGAFLANFSIGAPFYTACGIGLGNTLEALCGAYLLRHSVGFRNSLERLQDVLRLVVCAALLSTAVSSTFGVLSLWVSDLLSLHSLIPTWRAWWVGDMLGNLVVAPLLLVWSTRPLIRRPVFGRIAEGGLLTLLLVAVNLIVFFGSRATEFRNFPISYLIFPPLIWAALRFGQRGTVLATFVTSFMAVWGTVQGLGPFTRGVLSESLLSLQLFMGVVAVTAIILAAVVAERARSEQTVREREEALRLAHDELETRVLERTKELARMNDALRAEVVERKRAEERLKQIYADLKKSHEELKTAQWRLIQAEKMETVGRLAAGVAHEVKNPLSIILMGVQYLSKRLPTTESPVAGDILEDMDDAIQRADTVVKGLMDFAASQELTLQEESLNSILEQSLLLLKHPLAMCHIHVIKEFQENLPLIHLDKNKIEQVFVNLFMNAIHAMPEGGTLIIRTSMDHLSVSAEVEDTGIGIPEDKLAKIFDPFFTTKPTGKGTGLGLTVVRHIVKLHRGEISVQNRQEGGVRATLRFKIEAEGGEYRGEKTHLARR